MSEALVWWRKTLQSPATTPLSRTTRCTWSVISYVPRPSVPRVKLFAWNIRLSLSVRAARLRIEQSRERGGRRACRGADDRGRRARSAGVGGGSLDGYLSRGPV